MKKEIWIFLIIFIVLSLLIHNKEFIEYPIQHMENLPNSSAYGLGYFHPLVFTFLVYIIFLTPRLVYKLFTKKKKDWVSKKLRHKKRVRRKSSNPFLVFVQIYFSADLAVTTKVANAAESFIAISAKIFLSNSIPDNFNPFMNLE